MSSSHLLSWDCKVKRGWGESCVLPNDILASGFLTNLKIYHISYYFSLISLRRLKVSSLYLQTLHLTTFSLQWKREARWDACDFKVAFVLVRNWWQSWHKRYSFIVICLTLREILPVVFNLIILKISLGIIFTVCYTILMMLVSLSLKNSKALCTWMIICLSIYPWEVETVMDKKW